MATLLERLNSGMEAVDLPAGCLVKYKFAGATAESPLLVKRAKLQTFSGRKYNAYKYVKIEKGAYLLYLGVGKIGPRTTETQYERGVCAFDSFVHQFYYGDKMLYLTIDKPDKYYTVFRRHFSRVNNKNNLCK